MDIDKVKQQTADNAARPLYKELYEIEGLLNDINDSLFVLGEMLEPYSIQKTEKDSQSDEIPTTKPPVSDFERKLKGMKEMLEGIEKHINALTNQFRG